MTNKANFSDFGYMVVDDDFTNNLICKLIIKKSDPYAQINLFSNPEAGLEFIKNSPSGIVKGYGSGKE